VKSVQCRYCRDSFTPAPGKPGYIDECPACLHEKTAPPHPHDAVSAGIERKAKGLRKSTAVTQMLRKGRSLNDIDAFLFEVLVDRIADIMAQTKDYWHDKKRAADACRPQLQEIWSEIVSTQD
jgi:hypothetical protein